MEPITLEQLIRRHITLGRKNSKGWEECLHIGCDRGNKGNRAAFLFEDKITAFHCFNCGVKTIHNPLKHTRLSRQMIQVLTDFGIPESEWLKVSLEALQLKNSGAQQNDQRQQNRKIEPAAIDLPGCFYMLDAAVDGDPWAEIARHYLENRLIDPAKYPFLLCRDDNILYKKWVGRVIIPIMKGDNVVFYQGRDLTGTALKKYESPPSPKNKVIFGFDNLYTNTENPLYVVEGVFDAMLIDGVALMGNDITDEQCEWLDRSPRQKVYIPDRYGNGQLGATKALARGWSVSIPWERSWDSGLKDITDMMLKYGKLYVMARLVEMTAAGTLANTLISMNCVKKQ